MPTKNARRSIFIIYIIGLFFSLHTALPAYLNSLFLTQNNFIDDSRVGIVYTAASLLTIICFTSITVGLKRFGNYKTTLILIALQIFACFGLASAEEPLQAFICFTILFVAGSLIHFNLDIFLEHYSKNNDTGRIRGNFLSIVNIAWVPAPIFGALLIGTSNFALLYIIAGILLIPVLILVAIFLKDFQDSEYRATAFWESLSEIWADRDLKSIMLVQLLLQTFYSWMIIYTPLYLSEHVGFDQLTIGFIIGFALIPFVLLDAPLGKLADTRYGEKEMLSIGFVITGIATVLIAIVTDHNPFIWAGILFCTRVGAAMIEEMAEVYFFKKVKAEHINVISLFRSTRPIAYVVAPVIATLLFTFIDIRALFIALGLLMLYGLRYSLHLRDTR